MAEKTRKTPTTEKCPYCEAERKIPMYAYAHWDETFIVTCGNDACGKRYMFYQGHNEPMAQKRKSRGTPESAGGSK